MSAKLSELNEANSVEAGDYLYLVRGNQSFRTSAIAFAGADGADGDDGAPGINGVNGANGVNGVNGINGVNGANGVNGVGVPAGGTTGQVLVKVSDDDHDTGFNTLVAALITDASTVGKAVLTAANNVAARAAIGAGTSSFNGEYPSLNNKPTLGNSAAMNVGNTAGTVSAGDHTHSGGSDAWTYVKLSVDFVMNANTAANVTGLSFTPVANTHYEFESMLYLRTATSSVNPRTGLAWPSGLTDGVAMIDESQAATGAPLSAAGNPNAALLIAVGGVPNNTQSWPARIKGSLIAGATPAGNVQVQLASETAATNVTAKAGSWLKYRTIP